MPSKAAVRALPIATSMEPSTAPSIRAKPFRCVPASITTILAATPIAAALARAAAMAVVGSPAYFAGRAAPKTPADLTRHICIRNLCPSGVGYPWSFGRNGEEMDIDVKGLLALHDHELMIEAALAGTALAYVWQERARPYLANGRLLSCLDDWIAPEGWLYLYYPTRKYLSAGLRAVIEALRA